MKKKTLILFSILLSALVLAGCSSSSQNAQMEAEAQEEAKQKSMEEKFEEFKQETFNESNELLTTFNQSLDGLYTGQVTNEQFIAVVTKLVTDSQTHIAKVEKEKVDSKMLKQKQQLIAYLNSQHDLFLTSVDMAVNSSEIRKEALRDRYLRVKREQTELLSE